MNISASLPQKSCFFRPMSLFYPISDMFTLKAHSWSNISIKM